MKNKLLILVAILLHQASSYAKPNIVVSITPIASLVSMLTKDAAQVIALDISGGCPHHHHAKPSNKSTIDSAQMVIYIDDNFDELVSSMLVDYKGVKVKISDFSSLNFKGMNGAINWHFWLDLDNVEVMQHTLANILIQHFPELEHAVQQNLLSSTLQIDQLVQLKRGSLAGINSVVLLSDSLEHFFKSLNIKDLRSFQTSNTSLKNMQNLNKILHSDRAKCIILTIEQNAEAYSKYNKPIIQLNSENWVLPEGENVLPDLFIEEYTRMIKQLKPCV